MQLTPEQEAQDPNTSPERLRELCKESKTSICQVIAANPNIPMDVLFQLFAKYPIQIFNNPVFDLLLLENPLLLDELYKKLKKHNSIFKHLELPLFFLEWGAKHQDWQVRANVAESELTPPHLLKQLACDKYYRVRNNVVKNANTPDEILDLLAYDPHEVVRITMLENSRSEKILNGLVEKEQYIVRLSIAKNHRTPANILQKLLQDKDESIRYAAAKNFGQ